MFHTRAKQRFLKDTSGAITIDWVVLTAATAGMCFAAIYTLSNSQGDVGDGVAETLEIVGEKVVEDKLTGL